MKVNELKKENAILIPKCWVADSFFSRFLGLMGRSHLPKDEAIIFPNCNSIHTFFMRFPIDVVMVSNDGTVKKIFPSLRSWRITRPRWEIKHVVELSGGRAAELGLSEGDQLNLEGLLN